MTNIFNDGKLEATLYENGWVYCRWLNQHGRLSKQLIKDLTDIEWYIFGKKYHGWFTDSELVHKDFHRLLVKFGAMPREVIGKHIRFVKPIRVVSDIHIGGPRVRIAA